MNKRTNLLDVGAAVLSGLLVAGAFPKWNQSWLLIFALVPLLWALQGKSLKAGFGLGLLSGLAHFAALLYWIVYVTHVFGHLPLAASIGILFLLAGYLSLYPAVWGLGLNWGASRGLSPLWWGPILWVTLEFGQTYIISGFPWELLGNGLYLHPMLLQVADLTGVYGLSFLVVLVNAALFLALSPPRALRKAGAFAICRRSACWWSCGWATVITAWPRCGTWRPGIRPSRWPWSRAISSRAKSGRRRWPRPP